MIQMPPIRKGTSGDVVKMIWEFLQLDPEGQKQVEKMMFPTNECGGVERFTEEFMKLYRDMIQEAASLTCWIYDCKYNKNWSLAQMLEAHPEGEVLITAIYMQLDILMNPSEHQN